MEIIKYYLWHENMCLLNPLIIQEMAIKKPTSVAASNSSPSLWISVSLSVKVALFNGCSTHKYISTGESRCGIRDAASHLKLSPKPLQKSAAIIQGLSFLVTEIGSCGIAGTPWRGFRRGLGSFVGSEPEPPYI